MCFGEMEGWQPVPVNPRTPKSNQLLGWCHSGGSSGCSGIGSGFGSVAHIGSGTSGCAGSSFANRFDCVASGRGGIASGLGCVSSCIGGDISSGAGSGSSAFSSGGCGGSSCGGCSSSCCCVGGGSSGCGFSGGGICSSRSLNSSWCGLFFVAASSQRHSQQGSQEERLVHLKIP